MEKIAPAAVAAPIVNEIPPREAIPEKDAGWICPVHNQHDHRIMVHYVPDDKDLANDLYHLLEPTFNATFLDTICLDHLKIADGKWRSKAGSLRWTGLLEAKLLVVLISEASLKALLAAGTSEKEFFLPIIEAAFTKNIPVIPFFLRNKITQQYVALCPKTVGANPCCSQTVQRTVLNLTEVGCGFFPASLSTPEEKDEAKRIISSALSGSMPSKKIFDLSAPGQELSPSEIQKLQSDALKRLSSTDSVFEIDDTAGGKSTAGNIRRDDTRKTNKARKQKTLSESSMASLDSVQESPPKSEPIPEDNFNDPLFWGTWQLARDTIEMKRKIGSGNFGEVWKGKLRGTGANEGMVANVAVKILKVQTEESKQDFLQEAGILMALVHPNIMKLYGVVTASSPILVVTEFLSCGSLQDFFENPAWKRMSFLSRWLFAVQIAEGMSYMEDEKYIHRDLAARNILIDEEEEGSYIAKVGDLGLSKYLGNEPFFKDDPTHKLPIRWSPPEAFNKYTYYQSSDVWSYGIVLYEIATGGLEPYHGYTHPEVMKEVNRGTRLPCPKDCPVELHAIMLLCWEFDVNKRPTFSDLRDKIADHLSP